MPTCSSRTAAASCSPRAGMSHRGPAPWSRSVACSEWIWVRCAPSASSSGEALLAMSWKLPVRWLCSQGGAMLGSRSLTFPTVCFPASLVPSRQCPMVAAPREPGLGSSQTLSSAFSVMVAAVACSSGLGKDDKPGLHRQQWLQAAPGHPIRDPTAPCMLRTGYGFLEGGTISFMMGDHPFQSPA